jgi:major membrane immunogen (membrane-anchored lipoprotein)
MKVLKFVEVRDDNEMRKEGSIKKEEAERHEEEKDKEHEEKEKAVDEDHDASAEEGQNKSDANSSLSGAGEANEEIRTLKDFKALISEKTTPKSIKILSRVMIVIYIIKITLACKFLIVVEFIYFSTRPEF